MADHQFLYDEDERQLTIILGGGWTYDDARAYQKELMAYVNGLSVDKVLLDQWDCDPFPDECMPVFAENNSIPALRGARVAMLVTPKACMAIRAEMDGLPFEIASTMPVPFDSPLDAQNYLRNAEG